MMIGKVRFDDGVWVAIMRLEDGGLSFRVQESDVCFQFKENYAFGMACEGGYLLAWCADKFAAVDLNASQIYQHTANDFISDAFIEDDLFLVCDTTIVAKDVVSWETKKIYGHPEIIGTNKLDRKSKLLYIYDVCGGVFSYDLINGEICDFSDQRTQI